MRIFWLLATVVLFSLGAFACGGGGDDDGARIGGDDTADDDTTDDDAADDDNDDQAPGLALRIGGSGPDSAQDVATDAADNLYVAGGFSGTADFDPGPGFFELTSQGDTDIFLAKYERDGQLTWAIAIGGPGADLAHSLALGDQGAIWIIGYFSGTVDFDPGDGEATHAANGERDVFLAEYDNDGGLLQVITFGGPDADGGCSGENSNCDEGMDVAVAADGAVFATGRFNGTIDLNPGDGQYLVTASGDSDAFVAKYGPDAGAVWGFKLGESGQTVGMAIDAFEGGTFAVAGNFTGTVDFDPSDGQTNVTAAQADVFAAVYGADSAHRVFHTVGEGVESIGPGGMCVGPKSMDVVVVGRFTETVNVFPILNSPVDVFPNVLSGSLLTSNGGYDIFIVRYRAKGGLISAFSLGGPGSDSGARAALDPQGNVYLTGQFHYTVDVDPGGDVVQLTAQNAVGAGDALLAKYTAEGDLLWARGFGGDVSSANDSNTGRGVAASINGSVAATGEFFGQVDFDPAAADSSLTSAGDADGFVLRYGPDGYFALSASTR
jgi:hypothetical protein